MPAAPTLAKDRLLNAWTVEDSQALGYFPGFEQSEAWKQWLISKAALAIHVDYEVDNGVCAGDARAITSVYEDGVLVACSFRSRARRERASQAADMPRLDLRDPGLKRLILYFRDQETLVPAALAALAGIMTRIEPDGRPWDYRKQADRTDAEEKLSPRLAARLERDMKMARANAQAMAKMAQERDRQ